MLFGHQNGVDQSGGQSSVPVSDDTSGVNPLALDPVTGMSLPAGPVDIPSGSSVLDQPASAGGSSITTTQTHTLAPITPLGSDLSSPDTSSSDETTAPSLDIPAATEAGAIFDPAPDATSVPLPLPAATGDTSKDTSDLLTLKQQAIAQLSPLVSQLDQTPEEKFRTTMMLIQSTDNPGLLHDAYTAAQTITDEKARAQALLDVVNEINYFTQKPDAPAA